MKNIGYNAAEQPIVILDSGRGGIEILKKMRSQMPLENFILLIDNDFMPYGNKKEIVLRRRIIKLIKKIKEHNPKQLIIGCNTISSLALDSIKAEIPYVDVIDIIRPTAQKVLNTMSPKDKVSLIATLVTVRSQSYMYALNSGVYFVDVLALESAKLASAIEHDEQVKLTFDEEVQPILEEKINYLILGCTHYTKISPMFKKKFKDVIIIDSAEVVIEEAMSSSKTIFKKGSSRGYTKILMTKENPIYLSELNDYEELSFEQITVK